MNERDMQILKLVHRYQLMLAQFLEHQPCFQGLSASTVRGVLARLVRNRLLSSHQLLAAMVCYRLGPKALPLSREFRRGETKPLPSNRIPTELGALIYCFEREVERLTPAEMFAAVPSFPPALFWKHPYYIIERAGQFRLVQIRVELSRHPENIIQKHRSGFYKNADAYPAFRTLYENKHLQLVVIAPHESVLFGRGESDSSSLQFLLRNEPWYPPVELFHCPMLADFHL